LGKGWENADCVKSKAELPIKWWLGFLYLRKEGVKNGTK